jgi:myo-inositol 2-dehydrogenase/D-chiro-inositol 1-dehydrogenase
MNVPPSALSEPVRVGLIGAHLVAIADLRPGAAEAVAAPLGARAVTEPAELFSDPQVEAIVIAASSTAHTRLILAAIAAGKAVFCEKPMAETLEDVDRVGGSHRSGLFT